MAALTLAELLPGQEADVFVLLAAKEELLARNGKPYYRVTFRDRSRELNFPIWGDSPWAAECRDQWTPGAFYKIRTVYRETNFGPQLEIRKLRTVCEADADDGFDPRMFLPRSRFDPVAMFDELLAAARAKIASPSLLALVEGLLVENRDALLECPAARHNHHAFLGGWLEHTLAVTQTCVYLAEKYAELYPALEPPLDVGLVVAGGILHDIGKLREISAKPEGTRYTAEGALIGHLLQGRDLVREAAARWPLEGDALLRLEHILVSHQRLSEWGSPKPPMTPEALLVHYADDCDAKFAMMATILREDRSEGPVTSKKNVLMQQVYRGSEGTS